jgi:hypothetical protein
MRWALAAAVALSLSGRQPAPTPGPVPVVVELFTSEGCSSCPPADSLLSKLAAQQSVPGVQIIPLGMHVTYWDQLGWKDPASLREATERQQDYSTVFGADRVYTPQTVIDGRAELVGSDDEGIRRAIARIAREPHASISVEAAVDGPDRITASIVVTKVADAREAIRAVFVITEDSLTSVVKRGENGGRTLHNDAVVRRVTLVTEKRMTADGPPVRTVFASIPPAWRRERLHVVAMLQGEQSRRVWASATTALK